MLPRFQVIVSDFWNSKSAYLLIAHLDGCSWCFLSYIVYCVDTKSEKNKAGDSDGCVLFAYKNWETRLVISTVMYCLHTKSEKQGWWSRPLCTVCIQKLRKKAGDCDRCVLFAYKSEKQDWWLRLFAYKNWETRLVIATVVYCLHTKSEKQGWWLRPLCTVCIQKLRKKAGDCDRYVLFAYKKWETRLVIATVVYCLHTKSEKQGWW